MIDKIPHRDVASAPKRPSDFSPETGSKSSRPGTDVDTHDQVSRKVFLETYGCQMNEYDSELIRAILSKEKYAFVQREDDADIIMLNTCAIRENAHRKVYGRIHDIKHKRRSAKNHGGQNPNLLIGVLGCMATNLRQKLLEDKNLKIDFIAGPDSYKKLPQLIREASATGQKVFDVTLSEFETYSDIYPNKKKGVNAFLSVQRGCNNFCTFCVVPYTRGRERSRAPENIVGEVKRLAADGFKQITLLGQNVNSYRYQQYDFADLMEMVSGVEGIERIRFTSPHPKDFPDKFLSVMANNKKVCNHIHLPLQAGNNRVLEQMDRSYSREEFFALVDKIRATVPGVVLTTDIIVGFPTETDAEFEDTITAMQKVQFDSAFIFKYSQREGTIASKKFQDDVPDAIKTERIVRLNEIQKDISFKRNQAHIGEVHDVLIEGKGQHKDKNHFNGRNDGNKLVIVLNGEYRQGEMIKVNITEATPHVVKGHPVTR